MKIEWSSCARKTLREFAELVCQEAGERSARHWIDGLEARVAILATHPHAGRMVPEVGRPDVRELLYRVHRVIYQLDTQSDLCTIVSLRHARQDTTPENYSE